jgi:putative aldouronate transport system substrate-binding protein
MKKSLVLLVTVAVLLSIAVAATAQTASYTKVYDPQITFTTILSPPVGDVLPAGQTVEVNVRSQWFTKVTGLVPKVVWYASGDAYAQKLNLAIAAGDIPDYFEVQYVQFDAMAKAGLLADLTDLYNNLVDPPIKKIYQSANNADIKAVTRNSKIMGLPKANGLGDANPVMWTRNDWMKKLNLRAPTTIADVATIAKAFMKNDPDGNGKADTLGLIILPKYSARYLGLGSVADIFTNFGATPGQWRVKADGTVLYGSLMPEAEQALELLNSWYTQGLVPKDFATWNADTYKQKVSSGASGIMLGEWWNSWGPITDTVVNNKTAEWTAFALPKDAGRPYIGGAPNPAGASIGVINAKMKNPEEIIYALNDNYEYMQTPQYENDMSVMAAVNANYTPMMIFPIVANSILECSALADRYAKGTITRDQVASLSPDDVAYNLLIADAAKVVANNVASGKGRYASLKDWSNSVGYTVGMMAMYNNHVQFVRSDFSGITATMAKKGTFLDTFENQAYTKMIMGDTGGLSTRDYFNNFVKQYLAQGGQQITDEVAKDIAANK